jgi:hypothetical protein
MKRESGTLLWRWNCRAEGHLYILETLDGSKPQWNSTTSAVQSGLDRELQLQLFGDIALRCGKTRNVGPPLNNQSLS